MRSPRIFVAEEHTLVVEGFRRILEHEFEMIGTAEDGMSLVREAVRLKPDVILTTISLPLLSGFEAARHIKAVLPNTKILVVTMHTDFTYVRDAFLSGADGYFLKQSSVKELERAIREVWAGRPYISPQLTQMLNPAELTRMLKQGHGRDLTTRQMEILRLISTGRTNNEIAAALGITPRTVRFHRGAIARKLGIAGTPALTRYAVEHGIVPAEEAESRNTSVEEPGHETNGTT